MRLERELWVQWYVPFGGKKNRPIFRVGISNNLLVKTLSFEHIIEPLIINLVFCEYQIIFGE